MKQSFLSLCHTFNPKKHEISARFVSEKLDGLRFFWDGGISRGEPTVAVPWSNTKKSNQVPVSTGLWSRYGKAINAPDWWLDLLPDFPIDGELWSERGQFQKISSVVRSTVNQKDWNNIRAMVFDTPPVSQVFKDRKINETNFKRNITSAVEWYYARILNRHHAEAIRPYLGFESRLNYLKKFLQENSVVRLHLQKRLSFSTKDAKKELDQFLNHVLDSDGEGVIIKTPNNIWEPERQWTMLKYKPWYDAEATVIGYTWGRKTDKGSKLLGKMGALICEIKAGRFKLSGFMDSERQMVYADGSPADEAGYHHPGHLVNGFIHNPKFPRGSKVTYKYRELTDARIPKEARFWRKAD